MDVGVKNAGTGTGAVDARGGGGGAMREEDREAVNLLLTLSGEVSPNTTTTTTTTTDGTTSSISSRLNRMKRRRGDVALTVDTKVGLFDPLKAHLVAIPSSPGAFLPDGYRSMDGDGEREAAFEKRSRTLSCLAELATIEFDRACSPHAVPWKTEPSASSSASAVAVPSGAVVEAC
jgi:hypothetical protein